jgi:hypothetical protein
MDGKPLRRCGGAVISALQIATMRSILRASVQGQERHSPDLHGGSEQEMLHIEA